MNNQENNNRKAVISTRGVTKTFDLGEVKVRALRGVDMAIYEGDFVAIMGHSGSGKSTFMNLIGCLDIATTGEVYINAVNVANYDPDQLATIRNKQIGFVFQSYNLLARTTALENVELPLLYNPEISAASRDELSKKALEKVGLSNRMLHLTNQLSGGQQQRIAIARALVNEPLVILADEPTGNLDTRTSYEIMEIFQDLNDKGKTIVIITHEPDIAAICKRNIVFKDGKIIKDFQVENPTNVKEELAKMPKPEEEKV